MQLLNVRPNLTRLKSTLFQPPQPRKIYNSPALDEYQKMATQYKNYINSLSPKIEKVYEKENYRSYLKQQKLNMIKSHLFSRKEELEKKLEEKLDPLKSANGKLHSEINKLNNHEANYKSILVELEAKLKEKHEQMSSFKNIVDSQRQTIKYHLKKDYQNSRVNDESRLPNLQRNASETSFASRDSSVSNFSRSRASIISKLTNSIFQKTMTRLGQEQQKLIMLKLYLVFLGSPQSEQTESNKKMAEALEKQVSMRESIVKEIKKQIQSLQMEKNVQELAKSRLC